MDTTDRPAFAEKLKTLHSNGVRTVIVEKLDRLARELMVQKAALSFPAAWLHNRQHFGTGFHDNETDGP